MSEETRMEKMRRYRTKWRLENPEKQKLAQDRWVAANRGKVLEKARRYRDKNPGVDASRAAKWREENPRAVAAHAKFSYAVSRGKITKLPCAICGSEKTEAHHPSYDMPLDVVWLCVSHHRKLHSEFSKEQYK